MGFWGNETSVRFPNLGIELSNLPRGISIGSFEIAFYGIIIAIGMLAGVMISRWKAKKTGQTVDLYLDFALWAIPLSVIGARIYYVIFDWDNYRWDFLKIINIRNGGLAIYGGVIVAILSVLVFTKIKKLRLGLMMDTGIIGLILGQIIGRWGNFFNREAFGKFTDSFMAMQIDITDSALHSVYKPSVISDAQLAEMYVGKEDALNNILEIRNNIQTLADGRQFIQVHPTFLYESLWNLMVLLLMLFMWKRKKFNGEILLIYLTGYGLGRFFIEGLRTDQLFLWGTGLAASQLLSAGLFVAGLVLLIVFHIRAARSGEAVSLVLELEGAKSKTAGKTKNVDNEKAADIKVEVSTMAADDTVPATDANTVGAVNEAETTDASKNTDEVLP